MMIPVGYLTLFMVLNTMFYVICCVVIGGYGSKVKRLSDRVDNIFKRQGEIEDVIKSEIKDLIKKLQDNGSNIR